VGNERVVERLMPWREDLVGEIRAARRELRR
jgi:hypothetical protein